MWGSEEVQWCTGGWSSQTECETSWDSDAKETHTHTFTVPEAGRLISYHIKKKDCRENNCSIISNCFG